MVVVVPGDLQDDGPEPRMPGRYIDGLQERDNMKRSDGLDLNVAEGVDVSPIKRPTDVSHDDARDETVCFQEINPCGMLGTPNHS